LKEVFRRTAVADKQKKDNTMEKIQAAKGKIYLMFLGVIAFVLIGFFMIVSDTSIFEKLIGILAIVFFGGFGGKALYSTLIKGSGHITLTSKTLNLSMPDCPEISINWNDIESFGVNEISGQKFTTIKLNNYNNLIRSVNPRDADKLLKKFKSIKAIGNVTAVVGLLNFEDTNELLGFLPKSSELKNLAAYLNYSRNKFDGEFLIGWNLRDRNASKFAEYLSETKIKYTYK
jgi:hypothetical protein